MNEHAFLILDSGGSKTNLLLCSPDGQPLRETTAPGFGLALESTEPLPELEKAVQDFCTEYRVEAVVCNLGGKNKEQVTHTLRRALPGAQVQVYRESEGMAGVTLCRMYEAQAALLAGTGSIAIAPVGESTIICGGWGAEIGDDGSGYQLGLQAIRLALRQVDGTGPMSLLAREITGLAEPPGQLTAEAYCALRDGVRARLAPRDRANIARYSKLVTRCAAAGDPDAAALLRQCGRDLADLVLSAGAKTGRPLERVVVTGGMVHAKEFWQQAFAERLHEVQPFREAVYLTDGIRDAMYELAKKGRKEE